VLHQEETDDGIESVVVKHIRSWWKRYSLELNYIDTQGGKNREKRKKRSYYRNQWEKYHA